MRQPSSVFGAGVFAVALYIAFRAYVLTHPSGGLLPKLDWVGDTLLVGAFVFSGIFLVNLLLLFVVRKRELSERAKLRWKEVLNSRLQDREPEFTYRDTLDRAAQLKMALDRFRFRMRGRS